MSNPGFRRVAWLLSPTALLLCGVPEARAQQSPPDTAPVDSSPEEVSDETPAPGSLVAVQKARQHFESALTSYRAGRYRAAVAELELALVLDPDGKDLIFNLGQLQEKLGDLPAALGYFRRYLELEKNPLEKDRVEAIVRRIEGAEKQAERERDEPTIRVTTHSLGPRRASEAPVPEREEVRRGRLDGWVWGVGGAAGLALVVGVSFGIKAWLGHPGSDAGTSSGTSIDQLRTDAAEAESDARVSDVALGLSVVGAAAATLLYFARTPEPVEQARVDSPWVVRF